MNHHQTLQYHPHKLPGHYHPQMSAGPREIRKARQIEKGFAESEQPLSKGSTEGYKILHLKMSARILLEATNTCESLPDIKVSST